MSLLEGLWTMRQQHNQERFPNGRRVIVEQIQASEERNKSKRVGKSRAVRVRDSSRIVNYMSKVA